MRTTTVLLFLPPWGASASERWVGRARLSAAQDLIGRLLDLPAARPIRVLAAEPADRTSLASMGVELEAEEGERPFHFGRSLARLASAVGAQPVAYFGGASAPLASSQLLGEVFDRAAAARSPTAIVNNLHSTDWAVLSTADGLPALGAGLETDNPLGWALEREGGYRVEPLPARAGTQADIDTPADALLMAEHPDLGAHLESFLADHAPSEARARIDRLRHLLLTPASTLAIIGRSSSSIWRQLESRRQIWVRLFVEERGMLASGRADRGEVHSLVGELLDDWGPTRFVDRLAAMADGVLWDTRVWMAHRGLWPSAGDRFSADLGWSDEVEEKALRALTAALVAAPIPILTGGHSVVSGGFQALLESLPPVVEQAPAVE